MGDRQRGDDLARHAAAMADIAAGRDEPLTLEEMQAERANPLAFWRKRRGLTQAALAEQAGLGQSAVAEIESGRRDGKVGTLKALAAVLRVQIDDLV